MELVSSLTTSLAFFLPLLLLLVSFLHLFCQRTNPGIPNTYPLLGCLIPFYRNRNRLPDWYTELLAQSQTRTIVIRRLGATRTVVTANPENVEYILKTNFSNYPKGKPFTEILGDFLGRGIFNVDGELWLAQRKFASHEFTTRSLRDHVMSALRDEIEDHLLPLLERLAGESKPVDFQEVLRRLAFNMICRVTSGLDRCSLDPSLPVCPLDKAFEAASEICARRGAEPISLVWKVRRRFGIGPEKRLKQAVEEIHACVDRMIGEKRKMIDNPGDLQESRNKDFLSRLLLAGQGNQDIRDTVISFIMAGKDTTSAAMTWLFWLISKHPHLERDMVDEIDSIRLKNLIFDYDSIKNLRLVEACICEAMRLYPPVPWDSKHAITDDFLPDGTPVRARDRVTYFPFGMGRMEDIWGKDWYEFKPNRWFNGCTNGLKKVDPYRFPVFQAGPRVCLGKEMAFVQMKYTVAMVLERFEIKPVDSEDPVFVPNLTAHMAGGLKVYVQRRGRFR